MKLCIDCIHYRQKYGMQECHHKNNLTVSLIDGRDRVRYSIEMMRAKSLLVQDGDIYSPPCGPDGLWHEAKGE